MEAANILGAIKAGIVTETAREALLMAEARQAEVRAELDAIERFEPSQILLRAKEIYQQMAPVAWSRSTMWLRPSVRRPSAPCWVRCASRA